MRRLVAAAILAALAIPALGHSLALAAVRADPGRAYALAPWDGWIAAADSLARMQSALRASVGGKLSRQATSALQREPLAVSAIVFLGTQAQLDGRRERSRRLFAQSAALSRRNLHTQLWAIQDAVERGDIDRALSAYDIAFRTSSVAQTTLFPVLASAVSEPKIRSRLVTRLASEPAWGTAFLAFATRKSTKPLGVVSLLADLDRSSLLVQPADRRELVNLLFDRQGAETAWQYYRSSNQLPECGTLRHGDFAGPADSPAIFDWNVPEGGVAFVIRDEGGEGDGVTVDIPPNTSAVLLEQMTRLCPGAYRLEGATDGLTIPRGSDLFWQISCQGSTAARVPISGSTEGPSRYVGQFDIPPQCRTQKLELVAANSESLQGIVGNLRFLRAVRR